MLATPVKRALKRAIDYAATRIWAKAQYPDIDLIYDKFGMYGIAAYLQQCWNPQTIKEVLIKFGADIHPDCHPVGPNITLHEFGDDFSNLHLGPRVHVGKQVFFDLTEAIHVEADAAIGMRSIVLTHLNVGADKPVLRLFPARRKPVRIGASCSVGAGCIIACGVEIGEHALINAGVFVDRDIPPRTIVSKGPQRPDVQIPERLIKRA